MLPAFVFGLFFKRPIKDLIVVYLTFLLLASGLLCSYAWAEASPMSPLLSYQTDDFNWSLIRNKRDIKIYTSKVPNSKYLAVLSVMSVAAKPQSLAALVLDLDYCSKWASMCKEAKLQQQISATESIIYSLNNAPFPVRDRDVVAKVTWFFNQESRKISMVSQAIEGNVKLKKNVVRVKQAVSEWHFTTLENGQTLVENFAHIDPNGALPAWIINMLIIDSPYKTFKKMRSIVESGQYDYINVPFMPSMEETNDIRSSIK